MNDYFPTAPAPSVRNAREDRRQLTSVALAILFINFASVIIQIGLIGLTEWLRPAWLQEGRYLILISFLPIHAFAMPASILLYRLGASEPPEKKRMSPIVWLGTLSICLALTYIGNFIGTAVNTLIGILKGTPPQNSLEAITTAAPFWANLLFIGILAPILEEIFYRKLVLDRLRRFGDAPAILISAVLFGLVHGNFGQFFYAAMMGAVFGFIYLKTGRLRYTVLLHMAINLWGAVLSTEILRRIDMEAFTVNPIEYLLADPFPILALLAFFAVIGLCFLIAPIAALLMRKKLRLERAQTPVDWKHVLLTNPAAWICILALCSVFFLQ